MSEVLISAPGAGGAGDGGTLATRGGSVRGGATRTSRGAVVGGATRATMGAVVGVARGGSGVVVGVGRGGDGRAGRVVVGRGKVVGERTGRVVVARAGTVVGGGSGAGGGGGGGSVVGGGGGSVVGGGGGGGKVVGAGGVWTVVGLAAASTVGRTSISHSRAVADPRLPSASARARTLPRCAAVGTKSHVSAIPGIVWPSSRQEQRASPPTAGAAKRWRSPTRSRTLRARGLALASHGASACAGAGRPAVATRAASSSDVRDTRRVGVPSSLRRRSAPAPHGRARAADAQGEISCVRPSCRLQSCSRF